MQTLSPFTRLGDMADGLLRGAEDFGSAVTAPLTETTLRIGVTGLARAGKTVFISSLVANLLDRGRMVQLGAQRQGRIQAAVLQPQPDDTLPRFAYESHLADMTGLAPRWPDSTRALSQLRLSLRLAPGGLVEGMRAGLLGPRILHLDIVDYPGEWLLDLGLLDLSFEAWSAQVLDRMASRDCAQPYLRGLAAAERNASFDEPKAQGLATAFTAYLHAARKAGFSDCTPGRFLLPGDLEGSPVLTFAPLPSEGGPDFAPHSAPASARPASARPASARPASARPGRGSFAAEMARRFEAYKAQVVRPFFRAHFARLDRQVVLVDVLEALHQGPAALQDLRAGMAATLQAFRPGRSSFLQSLLRGRRVDKILFAATKADHLHHSQHGALTALTQALLRDAVDRAEFAGAATEALALASLRATTEEERLHHGTPLGCVRGVSLETGASVAAYAGRLPDDPMQLLTTPPMGSWPEGLAYHALKFAPQPSTLKPGFGPPHIRLDRAVEFLIGDRT